MDIIQQQIKEEIKDNILNMAVIEIADLHEEIKRLKAEIAKLKGEQNA